MVKFLVLALFYGDYPALALRCGGTLRRLWNTGRVDLRIGLNEVAPRCRLILDTLLPGIPMTSADPQIYKYPMMSRLLREYRGDATHMMWFDDDTCLLPQVDARAWLDAVSKRAGASRNALGSLYYHHFTPAQKQWVSKHPTATGQPIPDRLLFAAGGWVVVPLDVIRELDWPGELLHNGGDVLLAALMEQRGLGCEQFRMGLAINADAGLREGHSARRGFSEAGGSTLWHNT